MHSTYITNDNGPDYTWGFIEEQTRSSFAEIVYNAQGEDRPRLVNATLPQFCRVVDEGQARRPFPTTLRGCLGHSWDVWPVSLAKYAADMRAGARAFLAAQGRRPTGCRRRGQGEEFSRQIKNQCAGIAPSDRNLNNRQWLNWGVARKTRLGAVN